MSWQRRLLQSVLGVGLVVGAARIARLLGVGELRRQRIAKLGGVAPIGCESGLMRG
jgi:transposase